MTTGHDSKIVTTIFNHYYLRNMVMMLCDILPYSGSSQVWTKTVIKISFVGAFYAIVKLQIYTKFLQFPGRSFARNHCHSDARFISFSATPQCPQHLILIRVMMWSRGTTPKVGVFLAAIISIEAFHVSVTTLDKLNFLSLQMS